MLSEIRQQPAALERTLKAGLESVAGFRKLLGDRRPRLIVLAARGTSDNAALAGRYLLEITTGIPVSLAAPSISTVYQAPIHLEDALVVGISQSGESTDTNFVVERAAEAGAITVGITNESDSTLARLAQHTFLVRAGKEQSVAATKTYTGQLLVFYLLAGALSGRIDTGMLERIPSWVEAALSLDEQIERAVERYLYMHHAVVVARGLNYANAFEFSLKMMETSYLVAERFSSADLLHGPIAIVESGFPVFVFAPAGPVWPSIHGVLEKLEGLRAETLVFTDRANTGLARRAKGVIRIPAAIGHNAGTPEDLYTPIPYIVPAQLFAARLASIKGRDPDQPRGLKKVTQTL